MVEEKCRTLLARVEVEENNRALLARVEVVEEENRTLLARVDILTRVLEYTTTQPPQRIESVYEYPYKRALLAILSELYSLF